MILSTNVLAQEHDIIKVVQSAPWPIDTTVTIGTNPLNKCQWDVSIKPAVDTCPVYYIYHPKDNSTLAQPNNCCCYDVTVKVRPDGQTFFCAFGFDFSDELSICRSCDINPINYWDEPSHSMHSKNRYGPNFDESNYNAGFIYIQSNHHDYDLGPGNPPYKYRICGQNSNSFITCTIHAFVCENEFPEDACQTTVIFPASMVCSKAGSTNVVPSSYDEGEMANLLRIGSGYPNPSSNVVTFSCQSLATGNLIVEIFDLQGKKYSSKNIAISKDSQYNIECDATALTSNSYVALFSSQGVSVLRKFVVQH